ncbi:MAG: PaaI family thioesterase [Ilumatobacteraceae bacterium]
MGNVTPEAINEAVAAQYADMRNLCTEIGDGYVLTEWTVDPDDDLRPGGYVSGPTQFKIADGALWFLTFATLDRIEPMALTSELSIRFLRPAIGTTMICRATLEAASRRSVVGTCHLWVDGEPGRVTSTAQGTYAIPMPR